MRKTFVATTVTSTRVVGDGFEVTLADANGTQQTFRVPGVVAVALEAELASFSRSRASGEMSLTKLPNSFAVGTGRHDRIVLLRFEAETPYGLGASTAAELGRALIEESKAISSRPPLAIH